MQDALDALTEKTASSSPQNPEEHEAQLEEARRLRLRVEKKAGPATNSTVVAEE